MQKRQHTHTQKQRFIIKWLMSLLLSFSIQTTSIHVRCGDSVGHLGDCTHFGNLYLLLLLQQYARSYARNDQWYLLSSVHENLHAISSSRQTSSYIERSIPYIWNGSGVMVAARQHNGLWPHIVIVCVCVCVSLNDHRNGYFVLHQIAIHTHDIVFYLTHSFVLMQSVCWAEKANSHVDGIVHTNCSRRLNLLDLTV